ncbi:MAG: DUF3047 domain-containing protein [Burkholderiaceae bacterium]|nr:DUF3047 domain-containing protein [Burkholderiaceae bacterium]
MRLLHARCSGALAIAAIATFSGCANLTTVREEPASRVESAAHAPAPDRVEPAARPATATRVAPVRAKGGTLERFSEAAGGAEVPAGWQPWIIHPRKRKTSYRIVRDAGIPVLAASASGSASGLMARVAVDPRERPVLRWRWRADALVADADNGDGSREDAPLRVVLAFDGDKTRLPMRDQMFFERVKLLSGNELPYATLMYIWGNRRPVGTVLENPHSARIRKMVVDSGPGELRRWRMHRRNIVDDYRRAFGTEPGRLIGVAVLTDTDNTGADVSGAYGDIELLER